MSETANAAPLRQLVERRWRECTESRDVLLINSRLSAVPEEGIPFLVRFLDTADLKMKKSNLKRSKSFVDPFGLAYRRGDGSGLVIKEQDGYALLFNKFSVMDHHMLLVPDVPYPQTDPLTLEDFKRVVCLMDSIPSLFFYNCGVQSGASQPHKHIQMIPLDSFDSSKLPVDDVIASRVPSASSELFTIPQFRFEHRIALLNSFNEPIKPLKAEDLYEKYIQLLRSFHLREKPTLETITDHLVDTNESYNFLVTPNYMILVPRLKDSFSSINVNSLGFIGSLVVTSDETDSLLRKEGPLKILKNVAIPRE